jgi:mono/diheme cytochrome c family protein
MIMRYFFVIVLLGVVGVVSMAGWRGRVSRQPPREIFSDMERQPRLRPQKPDPFFADGRSSRLPAPGTIARGAPFEDTPVNTGCVTGTTNWVETNPLPVNAELLARGQERFTIYCSRCHGGVGDGNGITTKYGMLRAGNYHEPRLIRMTDGELFHTVTAGKNQMPVYAPQVTVTDRWAVIAYVRALELARLGTLDDVPEEIRANLKP